MGADIDNNRAPVPETVATGLRVLVSVAAGRHLRDQAWDLLGTAGPFTLTIDRPGEGGDPLHGFNGGQLLYLSVAGCVSNELFREAAKRGIALDRVRVAVDGNFEGDPAVSTDITYTVDLTGMRPVRRFVSLSTSLKVSRRHPTESAGAYLCAGAGDDRGRAAAVGLAAGAAEVE